MEISSEGRRSQLRIYTDILDFASKARRPTHIMHQINLNYSQLKRHLSWLVEMGFLEELMAPFHAFQITKKGENFVQMFGSENSEQVTLVPKFIINVGETK